MRIQSFRQINYSLRPAKSIERKMLCEGFGRLHPFQHVLEYQYVGFGSLYFSDFSLVHQLLGICEMVSIEKEKEAEDRFRLNKPFKCITLRFDASEIILPKLDWTKRHIVWLDYDGKLNTQVLADIATVVTRASSGTMLVVSVNAHPDAEPSEATRQSVSSKSGKAFDLSSYRLANLRESLSEKVPFDIQGRDLRGSGLALVLRQIILNEIDEQLSTRNIALEPEKKLQFEQVFNFHYRDGAKMLTVGGILFNQAERHLFEDCQFDALPFTKSDDSYYEILVPNLTPREMRYLNTQLPTTNYATLDGGGVPSEDAQRYAEIYRYFPAYHEVMFL